MKKDTAKELDSILTFLSKPKTFIHWTELLSILNIDNDNSDLLFSVLSNKEFIKPTNILGGEKFVEISMTGLEFIHSSSFFIVSKKIKMEDRSKNIKAIIAIVNPAIAIVSICVTLYFAVVNHDQDFKIKELEKENTTLRQEINSLKTNTITNN